MRWRIKGGFRTLDLVVIKTESLDCIRMDSQSDLKKVHQKIRLLMRNLVNIEDKSGRFLLQLNDGRVIDTKSWDTDTWEWTHGIGLLGIWRYYELTKNAEILKDVTLWFNKRLSSGVNVEKNINTMSPFLTLANLYEMNKDEHYLPLLDEWAEWAMNDLNRTDFGGMQHDTYLGPNTQQLWDDTLMMTVMPITKIGILLSRKHYLEEAKRQFLLHLKYLFDPATGSFFHGWTFEGKHNFARARWACGNSWLTIVLPDFIELLNDVPSQYGGWNESAGSVKSDAIRSHLLDTLHAQIGFLIQCQDQKTGMWHTLLDYDDEGSYLEASATAGFAYGILKSIRIGILPDGLLARSKAAADKAVRAVMQETDATGELQCTSFGTGMGNSSDFYRKIPVTSMPYGQAMAIMALGEYLRKR